MSLKRPFVPKSDVKQRFTTTTTLVKTPFKHFSKAKGRNVTKHTSFDNAVMAGKAFLGTYNNPETRIDRMVEQRAKAVLDQNRHVLSIIVDTIKLYGMHSLPLRGHREDNTGEPLTNQGVFKAILDHTAKCDPIIREHLEQGKRNQQYPSKTIQSQIISITADCLRQEILAPLKQVKYFSVMADRHANQEVLSLSLRFVDVTDTDKKPHVRPFFTS